MRPSVQSLRSVRPYQGAEHQPFHWEGGRPAALLVHGFLSSPAEMRPLALSLHRAGWTVRVPLLPGHGPGIFSLPERRRSEWVESVRQDVAWLRREHQPVVIVAHSMGGAVAVNAAVGTPPDGLVLLAPYWLFGNYFHHAAWPITRLVAGRVRPLRRADLTLPTWRRRLGRILPDVDLDAPEVQGALREFRVPVRLLDELHALGTETVLKAPSVRAPVLLVQGTDDEVVKGHASRRLAGRFANLFGLVEVPATHDLLSPQTEAWPHVEAALGSFLQDLTVTGSQGEAGAQFEGPTHGAV